LNRPEIRFSQNSTKTGAFSDERDDAEWSEGQRRLWAMGNSERIAADRERRAHERRKRGGPNETERGARSG
jgi:hypothetical protein